MRAGGSLVARLAWWFAASLLALYGLPAVLVFLYASAQSRQFAVLTLKSEVEALAAYIAESGALDAPELREPEEAPIPMWFRVRQDDRVLAQTPDAPELPSLPDDEGEGGVVSVTFPSTTPSYVVVRHQVGGRRQGMSVEAIGDMSSLQRAKRRLGWSLLAAGLVLIPLAALGGRALAQRALRPIGDLVAATRTMDPDRLDGRLRLPSGAVEEVAVLSSAFNTLLGRLEESVERMRRFTADASHEIRNPLSVLRTGLEVALRRDRSTAEYQELLRENLQEIQRLHAVVEGVLLLARDVRKGEIRVARDPVDLAELVHGAASFFAVSAAERGVGIEVEMDPDLEGLVVAGDAGLLRLVLFNLLDNALKHSPEGEVIRVELRRRDGEAAIRVSDRGPGVKPADRERVFERFFRGGPASGTGVGGLGLSVVRWIAEAHGGTARLLETDRGAAFEVVLPWSGAPAQTAAASA